MSDSQSHTLIVGAGLSGMTCARKLAQAGGRVTVLDQGQRPGGRLATRTTAQGPAFDHGAQYLTAKSVTFQQQVAEWVKAGVASLWDGRIVDLTEGQAPVDTQRKAKRYVGTPSMASIVEHLCDTSEIASIDGPHFGVSITQLTRSDAGWTAHDDAGKTHGPFGRVVLAIPAPQARKLLADPAPELAEPIAEAGVAATWTLMLAFAQPLELWQPFAGAFIESDAANKNELLRIINNSAKPGRPSVEQSGECWVLHATSDWTMAHLDDTPESVAVTLAAAFGRTIGRTLPSPTYAETHLWRDAHTFEPLGDRWLFDAELNLGVCGDAFTAGSPTNIERAWLSGLALAEHLGSQ